MYDPPMCCISGAIFPLNEFTVVHDTASTGKAFQLLTTLWLKEYLLSIECVHASSVNMFKNKIDKYLVKAGYT